MSNPITKENAIRNMQFFRIMTPQRSEDWEKSYDEMIEFIENSQPIQEVKEEIQERNKWDEIEKEYWKRYATKCHDRAKCEDMWTCFPRDCLGLFKSYFLSMENRIKELEEIDLLRKEDIHSSGEIIQEQKERIKELEEQLHQSKQCGQNVIITDQAS
jgi:DNA-directed RNA polymerase beta subunit